MMNSNVKIARELVRIAKSLVGMARFTDGLGEDTGTEEEGNTNAINDSKYEEILEGLYPHGIAQNIIDMGKRVDYQVDMTGGHKGTLGNGNLYLKYEAFSRKKQFIIMGFVSKKHKMTPEDKEDICHLFDFLHDVVEKGYAIVTSCNRFSLPFLKKFAEINHYHFANRDEMDEFGNSGMSDNNLSKECMVSKNGPSTDLNHAYDIRRNYGESDEEYNQRNDRIRRIQERREQMLTDILDNRKK